MAFLDVSTLLDLKELEKFLADNRYISAYSPSKADLSVFEALCKTPAGSFPHVQRWYRHIASFEAAERAAWGGSRLPQVAGAKPTVAAAPAAADNDDDVDLFGSDEEEEDAEAARIREERVAAYAANKSKKAALIAKSSVLLDVKPWDDETVMKEMENNVRSIEMDGLLWGASKLVPVGYGINKLQIMYAIARQSVYRFVDRNFKQYPKFPIGCYKYRGKLNIPCSGECYELQRKVIIRNDK